MQGIVSVALFMDLSDNIYVVSCTNKDRRFPINTSKIGKKLDDIPLDGATKNQFIDIISDTERFGIIIRIVEISGASYIVVSILLDLISQTIDIKNNFLGHPHRKTTVAYFIESEIIKNSVRSVFFEQKFSILDFLKIFGIKNFIILFIIVEVLLLIIGPKLIEPILKNRDQIIYEWITGDD